MNFFQKGVQLVPMAFVEEKLNNIIINIKQRKKQNLALST